MLGAGREGRKATWVVRLEGEECWGTSAALGEEFGVMERRLVCWDGKFRSVG